MTEEGRWRLEMEGAQICAMRNTSPSLDHVISSLLYLPRSFIVDVEADLAARNYQNGCFEKQ